MADLDDTHETAYPVGGRDDRTVARPSPWPDEQPGFRWDRFRFAVAAVCVTVLLAWGFWLAHRSSMENRRDERDRIEACRTIDDQVARALCIGKFDS